MSGFKPRIVQPGEPIRSEDWNYMQQELLELEEKCAELKRYIDNMSVIHTMTNLDSTEGRSYRLDETVPGETGTYGGGVVGQITRQWVAPVKGRVGICRFTVTSTFEHLDFWAGAEGGNRKALDVALNYSDGTTEESRDLFVHERTALAPAGGDNPFIEFLVTPSQWAWYRYRVVNPRPELEILSVSFANSSADARTRVGNVLQLRARVRQLT